MQKFFFVLAGLICLSATAQAQSSSNDCDYGYNHNSYGDYGIMEVCVEVERNTRSIDECQAGEFNQYGVCIESAAINTRQGKVIVEPSSSNVITNTANNKNVTLELSTDRNNYYTGDRMSITVQLRGGGAYVYVYGIDSQNKVTRLFPNRFDTSHYVNEGTLRLPRQGYYYRVNGTPGNERIVAIASTNPNFNLETATHYNNSNSQFATSGHISRFGTDLFKGVEIITIEQGIGLHEWDTDTVVFTHSAPRR